MDDSYLLAKNLSEIQYQFILLNLQSLSADELLPKLQQYFNEFKAIVHVSASHAEIQSSKYMPLLFTYQHLFNLIGGEIPKLEGINLNEDTTKIEEEIIKYLKEMKH